jgi:ABC-2 type transport system permease protein
VANPIELETESGGGRTWLLSAQVQAYAFALSLAFVCVLLAAAAVASERDENVLGRLARGLVRLGQLVVAKIALATALALALGIALAVVFGIVIEAADLTGGQPWRRLPLLLLGLFLAGAAFGAFGVLVGVIAREARTASLVGFLVALPLVLLGLLPEGTSTVAAGISAAFPLAHAVDFFEAALYEPEPWGRLGREAGWLAGLGAAFGAAARIGVRRLL